MLAIVLSLGLVATWSSLSRGGDVSLLYAPEALAALDPGTRGGGKALRVPIQSQFVGAPTDYDGSRHPQRGLERRGWGWKHLEDYRGYLYFMEGSW